MPPIAAEGTSEVQSCVRAFRRKEGGKAGARAGGHFKLSCAQTNAGMVGMGERLNSYGASSTTLYGRGDEPSVAG